MSSCLHQWAPWIVYVLRMFQYSLWGMVLSSISSYSRACLGVVFQLPPCIYIHCCRPEDNFPPLSAGFITISCGCYLSLAEVNVIVNWFFISFCKYFATFLKTVCSAFCLWFGGCQLELILNIFILFFLFGLRWKLQCSESGSGRKWFASSSFKTISGANTKLRPLAPLFHWREVGNSPCCKCYQFVFVLLLFSAGIS